MHRYPLSVKVERTFLGKLRAKAPKTTIPTPMMCMVRPKMGSAIGIFAFAALAKILENENSSCSNITADPITKT